MKVKMILPALTEATSPFWPPIKYSLFPPLGLATLAAYLGEDADVEIQDEHVETLELNDAPDLVVIQVYITSAHRTYRLADYYRGRGAYVVLGGLHVTSLPDEAAAHADDLRGSWRGQLAEVPLRSEARLPGTHISIAGPNAGRPSPDPTRSHQAAALSRSELDRRLARLPARVRLLLQGGILRRRAVVLYPDRRCGAGRDRAPPWPSSVFPRRSPVRRSSLRLGAFDAMRGMGRLWQAAGTVNAVLAPGLVEHAVDAGLRSLFVGFETLNPVNLAEQRKYQNMRRDYSAAVGRLHDLGVMINGSFVFGMDGDDSSVFERTVEWAITQGIETATFHILTPYPGTALYRRISDQGRLTVRDWDLYDTRHAVYRPALMSADQLEGGYRWAYREFYRWKSIVRGASAHQDVVAGARHLAYAAGWKKFEPLWDLVIRARRAGTLLPVLETILSEFGRRAPGSAARAWPPNRLNPIEPSG